MPHDLSQASAVVTGGGSGLGLATTELLVSRGCHVVVADIAEIIPPAVAGLGDAVTYLRTDVAIAEQVRTAVRAADAVAPLRVAVACAGVNGMSRVFGRNGSLAMEVFDRCLAVNLSGTAALLVEAAAAMTDGADGRSSGGVIVCTGSIAAIDGPAGSLAYAASKAGVGAMTLVAARDLAPFGVRVVTIAPGLFSTPMFNGMHDAARAMIGDVPFPRRAGEPAEFASLVGYIVENEMLNGTTIRLDGAYRMQ